LHNLARAQDRATDNITKFAGSLTFVYLHSVWFVVWVAMNVGVFSAAVVFDKFPFGLLTLIVSLEAIFLSTFVMISQNREARRAEVRAELDFETNLRSEIWSRWIAAKLGIDHAEVEAEIGKHIAEEKARLASLQ
jgi:uncharacterized membrane protein